MENKTKYELISLFGVIWTLMRQEEGPLAERCIKILTKVNPTF